MVDSGYFNELPFESECIVNNEEKIEIRAKLKCAEDVDAWLGSYAEMSATHWIVRKTYPRLQRLQFRKDYVCHHAVFNKETSSGGCNKRGKSKNCQCPAKLSVIIQSWTSKDTYAKRELFGKITITGRHNHSRSNAEALSLLPAPDSLRSVFEGYFFDGQGISDGRRFHVEKMDYSEVTVRLFKDIVLSRLKAYNVVSLVDFVCTAMEQYYSHRLLQFAHSRVAMPHIWLRKQKLKAAYVDAGAIRHTTDSMYQIQSETDSSVLYTIDVDVGICSCQDGMCGYFCKHQAAILIHLPDILLPNAPPVDTAARHRMAVVALGDKAQELSFYEPFTADDQPLHSALTSSADCSASVPQIHKSMNQQQSNNPTSAVTSPPVVVDSTNLIMSALDVMKQLHDKFGSSTSGSTRFLTRLGNVQTGSEWETFLHSFGSAVPLRHHHRASIRVQPTSLARRRSGITRGSKRLASGRPPSSDPLRIKAKRPRSLNYNIERNQTNAKSHGDGH